MKNIFSLLGSTAYFVHILAGIGVVLSATTSPILALYVAMGLTYSVATVLVMVIQQKEHKQFQDEVLAAMEKELRNEDHNARN